MGKAEMDSLSSAEHTAIGALAGIVEVGIMQPTVAIKNALQEGRPLPANPAAYYRGLLVSSIPFWGATSSQVSAVPPPVSDPFLRVFTAGTWKLRPHTLS